MRKKATFNDDGECLPFHPYLQQALFCQDPEREKKHQWGLEQRVMAPERRFKHFDIVEIKKGIAKREDILLYVWSAKRQTKLLSIGGNVTISVS